MEDRVFFEGEDILTENEKKRKTEENEKVAGK
jgi:hypothetical protein